MQQPVRITFKEMEPSDAMIEAPHDEVEVYFHRKAVLDEAFDDLHIGSLVRYVLAEGEGEAGPQASAVQLIGEVEP